MKGSDGRRALRLVLGAGLLALAAPVAVAGTILHVTPDDPLSEVSRRLATDPDVSEVVLAAGTYTQALRIPPFAGAGTGAEGDAGTPGTSPLLVRPADGARVVFDGAIAIGKPHPVKGRPGVYWIAGRQTAGEPPRLWEPAARVRYTLAADLDGVERFAGTYIQHDGRIFFHTSDSLPPGERVILASALDYGVIVLRLRVTVRDLEFRNFVARAKWSAGVQIHADDATIERCSVTNASLGFFLGAGRGAVVDCTARDVGGGVYVGGEETRVEGCRLFKRRDAFMVPTYAQDDAGIQFYHPARGGAVRGNLGVGFGTGLLIKASPAPWVVERNTFVGDGLEHGFIATVWHAGEVFRHNIVSGYTKPIQTPPGSESRAIGNNCYWPAQGAGRPQVEPGSVIADPGFLDPAAGDYRLEPDSPCLRAADDGGIGALPVADPAAVSRRPPREWHVSPSGSDGAAGTAEEPMRTIQAAIDRSGPGDTVLLHPGIYQDPVRIVRGGGAERPITLRALRKWTAILDGNRLADTMVTIDGAPFVDIRDLEIRWYAGAGIRVLEAEDVTVSGCRIWNAHWGGTWPSGDAIHVENSPRFRGDNNVLFSQERGFYLLRSPRAVIENNTAVGNLYAGAAFIYSIENSVCRNNSFAFQGNDALVIVETADGARERLATFDCDYNNYGMTIREQPPGVAVDRIAPRDSDRHLLVPSKAMVGYTEDPGDLRRFLTLREWREFSSLDRHSIAADPLYVSTAERDFRLEPSSPNIGAGAGAASIGAGD